MEKDQFTAASVDVADLPEIRFATKGAMTDTEKADEQANIEKLYKLVEMSFKAIASSTGLSDQEVLHVIKDTDVEMLEDVIKDNANLDELREGIQEAIKIISLATGLSTSQISDIFTEKKDDSLDGMVNRLYYKGQAVRDIFNC